MNFAWAIVQLKAGKKVKLLGYYYALTSSGHIQTHMINNKHTANQEMTIWEIESDKWELYEEDTIEKIIDEMARHEKNKGRLPNTIRVTSKVLDEIQRSPQFMVRCDTIFGMKVIVDDTLDGKCVVYFEEKETAGEFLHRDGDLWAREFMELWGNRLREIDVDLMRGWFCNAIEAGRNK
jgi:hypothetical protein